MKEGGEFNEGDEKHHRQDDDDKGDESLPRGYVLPRMPHRGTGSRDHRTMRRILFSEASSEPVILTSRACDDGAVAAREGRLKLSDITPRAMGHIPRSKASSGGWVRLCVSDQS